MLGRYVILQGRQAKRSQGRPGTRAREIRAASRPGENGREQAHSTGGIGTTLVDHEPEAIGAVTMQAKPSVAVQKFASFSRRIRNANFGIGTLTAVDQRLQQIIGVAEHGEGRRAAVSDSTNWR